MTLASRFAIVLIFIFEASTSLASSKAADTALAAFKKYRRTVTTLPMECVLFLPETATDFVLREKHEGTCGGDPATSPVVARLRVKGKKVFILDPVSGEFGVFNSKYKPRY